MLTKKALICGVSGQDGSYLAKFLLSKGYIVWGTSRDADGSTFKNLKALNVIDEVTFVSMVPENFNSVISVITEFRPDEIYFLAGQSSVGLSFEQPAETIQSSVIGILNMLEACRKCDFNTKLYNAGSSECFGDTDGQAVDIGTSFSPRSPYAVAKASAFWLVNNYREAYDIFSCTGVLFNHESPLRPERFVTQKIISAAKRIKAGSGEVLELGRTDIVRDWGWAPEYVEAMWMMLQQNEPHDLVIATGASFSLQEFVETTFTLLDMNWSDHVLLTSKFIRPTDILTSNANPQKARDVLGWEAKFKMHDVIQKMLLSDDFIG